MEVAFRCRNDRRLRGDNRIDLNRSISPGSESAHRSISKRCFANYLRRRESLWLLPPVGIHSMERVTSSARDATRDQYDGAGRFQQRAVHKRRCHIDLLQARRQIHRSDRRPRPRDARLRNRFHIWRCTAAAIPRRDAGRPIASARCCLGQSVACTRRSTLVFSISRSNPLTFRPHELDGH